ncbi:MAG TPA: hypothetical protein VIB39_19265 [Candidatus Angelobacter sp.]|jgi:hypothetical protein
MSSELFIPVPPVKLARKAWVRLFGLLLLALLGAVALALYGYDLYHLRAAVTAYQAAAAQFHTRTEAIHRLSSMEGAFNRYLLDGNSANLGLMQSDQRRIEQLAQQDASAQQDQLLQKMVAAEQKWSTQTVPVIEERKKLTAGQGLPEDFLSRYRAASQDLGTINFEIAADNDQRQAQQALQQAVDQLRWTWLPIPLAGLLAIGIIWLTIHATRSVHHLKQAAESEDDEDEDEDPAGDHGETK